MTCSSFLRTTGGLARRLAIAAIVCALAVFQPTGATPARAQARVVNNPAATTMLPIKEATRIGAVDGAPEYNLFMVSGVQIDPAGNYYVGMEFEVRIYDRNGKYVRTIGKHGKGPGEFNYAPLLWFANDTLMTIDRNIMRFSTFTTQGKLLETYNAWSHPHMTVHPIGSSSISWIALVDKDGKEDDYAKVMMDRMSGIKLKPGEIGEMPPLELRRYYPKNDSIGALVYNVRNQKLIGFDGIKENPFPFIARPFDDEPAYAMDARGYVYTKNPNEYSIDVFDKRGAKTMTVKRAYTPIPITLADFDGMPKMMVENSSRSMTPGPGVSRESVEARMLQSFTKQVEMQKKVPLPPTRPPVGNLQVSRNGTLWVERQDYMKPAVRAALKSGPNRVATRWDIFDAFGKYFGTVDLPLGYRVRSVTDDGRVAGVLKDEDGVEFVVVYQLQRAPKG